MREVELAYSEVMNTTEVLLVFQTTYYKKPYGAYVIINLAAPKNVQDEEILACIEKVANMSGDDARAAK